MILITIALGLFVIITLKEIRRERIVEEQSKQINTIDAILRDLLRTRNGAETLKGFGIDVRNEKGEIRDLEEILDELSGTIWEDE